MSADRLAVEVHDVSGAAGVPAARRIRAWIRHALADVVRGEIAVRIVGEQESAELNARYRQKAGPTNVLAFPAGVDAQALTAMDGTDLPPVGDLAICAPVVAREAAEQRKPLEAHWAHIVLHGALHLAGYDHESAIEERAMHARERELLAHFGFSDPYAQEAEVLARQPCKPP